jgi:hypothetical protein
MFKNANSKLLATPQHKTGMSQVVYEKATEPAGHKSSLRLKEKMTKGKSVVKMVQELVVKNVESLIRSKSLIMLPCSSTLICTSTL